MNKLNKVIRKCIEEKKESLYIKISKRNNLNVIINKILEDFQFKDISVWSKVIDDNDQEIYSVELYFKVHADGGVEIDMYYCDNDSDWNLNDKNSPQYLDTHILEDKMYKKKKLKL